ncbi:restriction endonuclease subunit S [Xanthomonas cannabis]|uniref:restriction endonuclease subunit S n=1 Tax=Xanthomonas cannabis TaxID=1885674 RepID=UPI00141A8186|nr:restriction endonuclease subunit S [Xanthomonas cannabis]NIK19389.1 type I restriction enzyme S subunit [Xanthomonas cannabis]
MKNSSAELPHGWNKATLGDLITLIVGGGTPSRNVAAYFDGNTPWFTVKDLKSLYPTDAEEHISDDAILRSATSLIEANTLIIATRIALGKAIIPNVRCAINQDLKALYLGRDVPPKFILYWFMANDQMIKSHGSGTTVKGIRLEHVKEFPLKVPPAREQCRIVDRIEELLSYLDAGIAEMKSAQRKLAKYRQSLLKAAVEGTLTADWRAAYAQNCETQETGAELLQRILTERRTRWEAKQLAKFAKQGKAPPNGWRIKYLEPIAPNVDNLPALPDGWTWASVDQLSPDDLANGRSVPSSISGAKVLRLTSVKEGKIDLSEFKHGNWSDDEARQFLVAEGDLLIIRGNGSLSLVGRAGIVTSVTEQVAYPDTMIRLRIVDSVVRTRWVAALWDSSLVRGHMEARARTSAGIYKISQPDIISVVVPIPPISEQDKILTVLDRSADDFQALQDSLVIAERQSSAQRKNILKAAFSGELVPQDPNDEPASVLLKRIRAERVAADAKRTGKTARKTKERT